MLPTVSIGALDTPTPPAWRLGRAGWLTNVLTATAVSHVDSAVVTMLQASVPLMVAVLARERRAGVRS